MGELQNLLLRCDYNVESDDVILVGDLVNKGPYSAEVIQFARESGFYVVKGNHEDNALSAYYRQGKYEQEVPQSYIEYLTKLLPEDISWLQNLPYTIAIPSWGILIVHAGIIPNQNITSINPTLLSRMRNLTVVNGQGSLNETKQESEKGEKEKEDEDGKDKKKKEGKKADKNGKVRKAKTQTKAKVKSKEDSNYTTLYHSQDQYEGHIKEVANSYPWVSKYQGPSHVYFGHDARRGLQKTDFATGLDTGC